MFYKAVILAVVLAASSVSANPVDPDAPVSIHVRHADLDLRSESGAQVMLGRIGWAASSVCGGQPDIRDLDRFTQFERCERQTINSAVRALNAPLVTSLAGQSASQAVASD